MTKAVELVPEGETLEQLIYEIAVQSRPLERLSVIEAAEKYVFIKQLGSYVGKFQGNYTPYMIEPTNLLNSTVFTGMVFCGPVQSGKALDVDTPMRTVSGWTTMGALKRGDKVFHPSGGMTEVTFATEYQHGRKCYEVEFSDGSTLVADADHQWTVKSIHRKQFETLTTQQIIDRGVRSRKQSVFTLPAHGELRTRNKDPLWVDPYLLGYWLGDGCRQSGYISVGEQDREDFTRQMHSREIHADEVSPVANRCPRFRLKDSKRTLAFTECLKRIGLRQNLRRAEKYIPDAYLNAEPAARRELLKGLMDSDGTVAPKTDRRVVFSSCEARLAEGVAALARSLGYRPKIHTNRAALNGVRKKDRHRVAWTVGQPSEVFSLFRKAGIIPLKKPRLAHSRCLRIVDIKPVPSRPVKCIQVDAPDSLYLAGEGLVPTHNTQTIQSWLAYSVMTDPADMAIFQMTKAQAADFTTRRIDRLHRDSPVIGNRVAPGAASDGQHRKIYLNGMILTITWPSATEFASKSIPRLFLTDYDRMPMDVEGEGSPYDLAAKRATTFRRNAMTVAESTPSFPILDPRWSLSPERPHEAPPCEGILGLYNRGDRRRWHWQCVSCQGTFEPDFSLMKWPDSEDLLECAEQAYMPCPHCGQVYEHSSDDVPGKNEMNEEHAKWLIEGQKWTQEGQIIGVPNRSKIASFWLKGPAARFQTWEDIVFAYLKAEEAYQSRGDETYLQTTVNTQQALPYRPKHTERLRMPEDLRDRARDYGEKEVPDGVRFLIAAIDVQKNRFVVQVHGIGEGGDKWIIDRFDVIKSQRPDAEAGGFMWVNPGAYSEDWLELVDNVLLKTYPLGDASGRRMPIKLTLCDSGGSAGVTKNAYDFYRTLRNPAEGMNIPPGLAARFLLVAGRPSLGAPRLRIGFPDSKRKDRFAGARGEIPVGFLHSDMLKNELDGALDRTEPYGGRINYPLWLDNNFYTELTVEVKNDKGKWENPNGYRNESWDLLTYCLAGCIHPDINIETPGFWDDPPSWAKEWDQNTMVFDEKTGNTLVSTAESDEIDFEKLGQEYG